LRIPAEDGRSARDCPGRSFVDWFKSYPYAFSSADATPLFIVGVDDYVTSSGDVEFAKANGTGEKAYDFAINLRCHGYPKNLELGTDGSRRALLPWKRVYQNGAAVAAIRSLAHLAELTGKSSEAKTLREQFEQERKRLNDVSVAGQEDLCIAVDRDGKRVDEPTVLTTVPMWLGDDEDKSQRTIEELAKPSTRPTGHADHSNQSAKYSGGIPLRFSVAVVHGWLLSLSIAIMCATAYDNLRANACWRWMDRPGM